MNTKFLLLTALLIKLLLSFEVAAADGVVEAQTFQTFGECTGSLVIVTNAGDEKTFTKSKRRTSIEAKSLEVEGCGCYYVYKQRGFRASSEFIGPSMGVVSGDDIGFRIRSIERVSCEARAQPVWVVVCIVAGLVLLVAIIAIVGIKCYRKYSQIPAEDHSVP